MISYVDQRVIRRLQALLAKQSQLSASDGVTRIQVDGPPDWSGAHVSDLRKGCYRGFAVQVGSMTAALDPLSVNLLVLPRAPGRIRTCGVRFRNVMEVVDRGFHQRLCGPHM